MLSTPAFAEGLLSMDTKVAPFNDIHVRRAVAYAINPGDVIAALGNRATSVSTLIPPSQLARLGTPAKVSALVGSLPSYQYNLAKARQELAESAYPHGFSTATNTITFGSYTPANEATADDLAKIGITLKLKTVGFNQWLAWANGNKSALGALYETFNVTNPDPNSFASALLGSGNIPAGGTNAANYDPPVIDHLLSESTATQDPARRLDIYGQILRMLGTDLPYVPLYVENYNAALSSKFTWPGYNVYTQWGAWELNIRPRG